MTGLFLMALGVVLVFAAIMGFVIAAAAFLAATRAMGACEAHRGPGPPLSQRRDDLTKKVSAGLSRVPGAHLQGYAACEAPG